MWRKHHRAQEHLRPCATTHQPASRRRVRGSRGKNTLLGLLLLPMLALTSMGSITSSASAQGTAHARINLASKLHAPAIAPASPPVGFVEFCDRYPEECRPIGRPTTFQIRLTPTRWDLIRQVNAYINRKVKPLTDQEIYNRPEVWEYPTSGVGDCEDYVLLKKRYLEALGFPPEALLIAVVLDENGGGHAVLLVRTDRGDFALDNRRNRILPWNRTGYTYLLRQSQRDPGQWVAITRNPAIKPKVYGNN